VEPVGADRDLRGELAPVGALGDRGGARVGEPGDAGVGLQPHPAGHARAEQCAEQVAPVQHEVGSAVPGREVGQVERGQLTPLDGVSEDQPAWHNRVRHYFVEHIQLLENADGVRRQLDSRAHLGEARRALENGDPRAPAGQAQRILGSDGPQTWPGG
jgi:hypothetical protein